MLRVAWWALAAVAVAISVGVSDSSIRSASMSCSKIGELPSAAPAHLQCGDPLIEWVGVWPFVWLGLLLVTPPVVAALVMRMWIAWATVAAYGVLSVVWYGNWTDVVWGHLLFAAPLAAVAFVIATVQYARTPARESRAPGPGDCAHTPSRG